MSSRSTGAPRAPLLTPPFTALLQAAFQAGSSTGGGLYGLLAARAGYPAVFEAAALGLAVAFAIFALSPEGRGRGTWEG